MVRLSIRPRLSKVYCSAVPSGSVIVFTFVYILARVIIPDIDPNKNFDIAYYTSILSFLWIHYYHDHFLFTNFEALDKAYGEA